MQVVDLPTKILASLFATLNCRQTARLTEIYSLLKELITLYLFSQPDTFRQTG